MYNVTSEKELITIGEAGENIAESCTIDFNDWIQQYGQGDLRIRAIRAGDKQPYPVSNVTVSDGVATWTYTEADKAIKGYGEVQILYYVGDVLSKSRVWQTYTHRSLSVPGEPPQPYDDWIRQVEESADEAREYAASALESANTAGEYKRGAEAAQEAAEIAQELTDQIKEEAKTAKIAAENARNAAQGYATAAAQSAAQAEEAAESIEASADLIQKLIANQIHDTATGTIASFPDGADMPMVSPVADIDPIQDTSGGSPSPSNICPISGWDSVDVTRTGKNLFDADAFFGAYGGTKQDDGSWRVSNLNSIYHKVCFENKDGYTGRFALTWIHKDNASSPNFCAYFQVVYTDGTTQNMPMTKSADAFRTETAITRADKVVDYIWINYSSNGESYYYGQIEIGATATSYEPYQGHTITTTLPQTVYGGTLDVVSGVLTVTHVFKTFDGSSDEVWNKYGTGMRFTIEVSDYTSPLASIVDTNIKANYLRTIAKSGQGAAQWVISGGDTDYHVLMVNVGIESITDMRAYLAENPLEVVYPLATPTTITLTPTQIDSLLGSNNVWADSGDVTVEYIADTKLYIQKVIG